MILEKQAIQETLLKGIPISPGIAIGDPYFFLTEDHNFPEFSVPQKDLEKEIARYRQAVYKSRQDLLKLQNILRLEGSPEIVEIIETHLEMLQDPLMTTQVEENIRKYGKNTETIVQVMLEEFKGKFKEKGSFFQERVRDIVDVSKRVLGHLYPLNRSKISNIPMNSIILSHELVPSDIAEASSFYVSAFVSMIGGANSHAAIIARAKGVPYVANIDIRQLKKEPIQLVIVDGNNGNIIINPTQKTLNQYRKLRKVQGYRQQQLEKEADLQAETTDHFPVKIYANVETLFDVDLLLKHQAAGIGLFRSEYLFLAHKKFPTEEEQFLVYRQIVEKIPDKPVVLRLFDIGADKMGELLQDQLTSPIFYEANPALGCRAIRFLMQNPPLFEKQVRAMLRSSLYGNVNLLIPMISDLSELLYVKKFIYQIQDKMTQEGYEFRGKIPIGCMIEVPSIALLADIFIEHSDFFSIGTNDLTQYVLAADRTNPNISSIYNSNHLSLLRLIQLIISHTKSFKKPIILCGEMAADPKLLAILLGLGIREFSVSARHIPRLKHEVRKTSMKEALELAKTALEINNSKDLNKHIEKTYAMNLQRRKLTTS